MAAGPVLVVDFGAQYAQLIARRVREANVYSELVPHSMPVDEMLAKDPQAIILSGGPASVFEPGAPRVDKKLFEAGVPLYLINFLLLLVQFHQVLYSLFVDILKLFLLLHIYKLQELLLIQKVFSKLYYQVHKPLLKTL